MPALSVIASSFFVVVIASPLLLSPRRIYESADSALPSGPGCRRHASVPGPDCGAQATDAADPTCVTRLRAGRRGQRRARGHAGASERDELGDEMKTVGQLGT